MATQGSDWAGINQDIGYGQGSDWSSMNMEISQATPAAGGMNFGGMGVSIVQTAIGLYGRYKQQQAAVDAHNRRLAVATVLAAEALSLTYSSILNQSFEVGRAMRRKEVEIRGAVRAAEGKAIVEAARIGATGKRVQLARDQAILGGADRAMQELAADAKTSQDALIDRANMEERSTINRLASMAPNLPSNFDPVVTAVEAGVGFYEKSLEKTRWEDFKTEYAKSTKLGIPPTG